MRFSKLFLISLSSAFALSIVSAELRTLETDPQAHATTGGPYPPFRKPTFDSIAKKSNGGKALRKLPPGITDDVRDIVTSCMQNITISESVTNVLSISLKDGTTNSYFHGNVLAEFLYTTIGTSLQRFQTPDKNDDDLKNIKNFFDELQSKILGFPDIEMGNDFNKAGGALLAVFDQFGISFSTRGKDLKFKDLVDSIVNDLFSGVKTYIVIVEVYTFLLLLSNLTTYLGLKKGCGE